MKLLISRQSSVYWSRSASMFLSRMYWMCCLNIRPSLVSGTLTMSVSLRLSDVAAGLQPRRLADLKAGGYIRRWARRRAKTPPLQQDAELRHLLQPREAWRIRERRRHCVVLADGDAEPVLARGLHAPGLCRVERRPLGLGRGLFEPARLPGDDHLQLRFRVGAAGALNRDDVMVLVEEDVDDAGRFRAVR